MGMVSIFLSKYVFSRNILQLSLKTLYCYQIELSNVMTFNKAKQINWAVQKNFYNHIFGLGTSFMKKHQIE